ncbi:unnamed protein product, partial [Prorocentrum cordatum]
KAKRALQERYAQEDSKRRKLREDLEGRESAAERLAEAGLGPSAVRESAAEARRKFVQADTAARVKAREAERAQELGQVASRVAEARAGAQQARVRITWRAGCAKPSAEALAEVLGAFGVKSVELGESEATAQFGSREDAISAVLRCRERRHDLPFRVALAPAKEAAAEPRGAAPAGAAPPLNRASPADAAAAGRRPEPKAASKAAAPEGVFDSWEA